ncbi:MAG: dihydropteroate synthase [Bacteroidaceae bacterium]|nr:dihydropteroate synthase [Bacteroidaceae bacterium]
MVMRRSGVSATINVRGRLVSLDEPQVMGILNVTPDSFFATSRCRSEEEIRQRVCMMRREGATMVDIGAYSSRPGAEEVSVEEELRRLLPAVGIVREEWPDAIISVDTFRAEVARQAVEAGADIVNDISGGEMDKDMFRTVAELHVPYILMHMQGTPQDMQKAPHYDNLMCEVFRSLGERVEELHEMGVADVIVDPGFGFGKTMAQNYEMMARLGEFRLLGCPILVGISRKSMVYRLLDTTPEESLNGTTALNTIALMNGASILRVHDVRESVEAIKIYRQCLISD